MMNRFAPWTIDAPTWVSRWIGAVLRMEFSPAIGITPASTSRAGGRSIPSRTTFAPFRSFVEDGQVWVDPYPPPRDEGLHWRLRLNDGMEHNIRLVIAKAVLGLEAAGSDYREPLRIGAQFGVTYSANGWDAAMSILTCYCQHPA